MKFWIEEKDCSACGACQNICPKDALYLIENENGFSYPHIDTNKCIDCGKCQAVCPAKKRDKIAFYLENHSPKPQVFAAWSKNESIRFNSTSGGVFSELAHVILNQNGCIVGAVYDAKCTVFHQIEYNEPGLYRIRQSKYVQSEIRYIFRKVKKEILSERMVLFCGSPCQIAGLYSYLGENKDSRYLITVDFICRGANSPKAYRAWLQSLEKEYGGRVERVWFKNKEEGWNCFSTRVDFTNGAVYRKTRYEDLFMRSYLERNLFIRPSCTDCHYKGLPRYGDITLADFWKVDKEYDADKGTSMVLVNTEKGAEIFNRAAENLEIFERNLEEATKGNACLYNSVKAGKYSTLFFERLNSAIDFSDIFDEISEKISAENPLISVLMVADDWSIGLNRTIREIHNQTYKNIEIILIDIATSKRNEATYQVLKNARIPIIYIHQLNGNRCEGLNQALKQASGNFIHICDSQTRPADSNTYREIVNLMTQTQADAACLGYKSEENNGTFSDQVKNGFCGTGDNTALLREIFSDSGIDSEYTSYGNQLFNKILRRTDSSFAAWQKGFQTDLSDLADRNFLIQSGLAFKKVVFDSKAFFIKAEDLNSIQNKIKIINPENYFISISTFLKNVEVNCPRLYKRAVQICMEHEISLAAQAYNMSMPELGQKLSEHILSFYSDLVDIPAFCQYSINLEREVIKKGEKLISYRQQIMKLKEEYETTVAQNKNELELLHQQNMQLETKYKNELFLLKQKNANLEKECKKVSADNRSLQSRLEQKERILTGKVVRIFVKVQYFLWNLKKKLLRIFRH